MLRTARYIFVLILFTAFFQPSDAQFYNGLQMSFGKNRIQYNSFYWEYYRFDKFDTYFNEYGKNLALYTEWFANQELKRLEAQLDYTLERRMIFLIYNKLTDFRQSNIGLVTGSDDYNTGGVTRVVNNKVFLFYEGDHKKFQKQITSAISQVMLNEMLYGSELRENVANSTLISLPEWFTSGLLSYLSENWSVELEDKVKDGILSGKFKKFNKLQGDEAIYAGHSFWRFIEKTYGKSVIPNIIYITRVNKNVKSGFYYVLGSSIKQISKDWYSYYYDRYSSFKADSDSFGQPLIKHPKKKRVYEHIKRSPDGRHLAFVTNESGQYRLWLYDMKTNKRKCLIKREHKIDQIPDYTFPVIAWHPSGRILTYITEEKGGLKLWFYDVSNREVTSRNLLYFEKVLDFNYSDDGSRLVLSAMRFGKTDIYVHTLASSTNEQVTNDLADDLYPRFIDHSSKIIFSSNRLSDSLNTNDSIYNLSPFYRLFTVNYPRNSDLLTEVSSSENENQTEPFEVAKDKYVFLGDGNGIINRYIAEYDSSISFVDTTVHYRYFSRTFPLTNYPRNILENDYDPKSNKIAQIIFKKSKNYIFQNDLEQPMESNKLVDTEYRKELLKSLQKKETKVQPKPVQEPPKVMNLPVFKLPEDTVQKKQVPPGEEEIDVNHYVFEIEKRLTPTNTTEGNDENKNLPVINPKKEEIYKPQNDSAQNTDDKYKVRIYLPAFYVNYLVSQVDFTFLNTSYQPFNGGGSYYVPGFNLQFKLGANDLFEDYKVVGGARFAVDFDSNEYLLSFENLKKRMDKQLVFHRVAYKNYDQDYNYLKTTTNEAFFILKYPFSQVLSVHGTASVRNDRVATLAVDEASLERPTNYHTWGGLKLELIYDNTRSLGINIHSGTRSKVFGEAYRQIDRGKSDLFVLGADFRHYEVIHRNLIFATRIAGSTSFGHSRLVYYLGAVDNWINLSSKVPTFDNSIRIDDQAHYAYQALATNMRGFSQNVRNGNNFMVLNNEIRWPFIKYFARYPIGSNFWSSLQAVAFFDAGSAWTGLTPFSGKNAYDYDIVGTNPVVVTVDSNRSPIVYGYGYGLRAQVLGYFLRFDWAWGIENKVILPRVFYFSMNLDF